MISTPINGDSSQPIDFSSIPAALQELDQFVLWKEVTRGGQITKMPLSVLGRSASSTDSTTWSSFDNVVSTYNESQHSGIGFVFTPDDQFCGIDLDGCRDPETGTVADWAVNEVLRFSSYTEISPSQTGLKIWITTDSKLSTGRNKKLKVPPIVASKDPGVEIYTHSRFFTVTGQVYKQYRKIEKREAEVHTFLEKHWPAAPAIDAPQQDWRSDDAVVERARKYLARIPGAVSGSGGHNATFHVACVLVKGFALAQNQAFDVISEWNASCDPPWTENELQHKLNDAAKALGEIGYLRDAKPERWDSINIPEYRPAERKSREVDDGYTRFPVEALPPVLRSFVGAVSRSVGCDPAFAVMPALAACASAIGNTRRLRMKRGWLVPPILWCAVIGESGSQKSPPMRVVNSFLKDRQRILSEQFRAAMGRFKEEERAYKAALKKHASKGGDLPDEPQRPVAERCMVSDATIESLVPILRDNWRGVLLSRDELVGWIGSFDRYAGRGTASADAAHWLSIYNAECIIVDRKTGDTPSIFVPDAAVSVCGGIQPGILNRAISAEHRENGLLSRLLLVYPPRQPKQWRDDEIPQADEDAFRDLLTELFKFGPDTGADGNPKPAIVDLSDEARSIVKDYVNSHGDEQAGLTGDLAAAWSKLEELPARLALIIHCIRRACGEAVEPWICDADSMRAGVILATWFKNETERVYRLLAEDKDDRNLRQAANWIEQKGGTIRVRDLVSGRRDLKTVAEAESLLHQLVKARFGFWKQVPAGELGGRATMEFTLFEAANED
jgi:hypothetical protein